MPGENIRSAAVDALRLIGIAAIVLGHAIPAEPIRQAVFPWHVPVFFFLTGYLWKPGRTLRQEFRRRWVTLGRPYFAWLILIGAPMLVWEAATRPPSALIHRAGSMVLGGTFVTSPFQAFWFLCALFLAALAYRASERWWRWGRAWLLVPLLALSLVGPPLAWLPYAAGVAIPAVSFLVMGDLTAQFRGRLSLGAGVGALAAALIVTAAGLNPPMDVKQGNFGTPLVGIFVAGLFCVGLLVLSENAFSYVPARWGRRVSSSANLGLVVILVHGVPVYLIAYRWPPLATLAATAVFAVAVAAVVSRLPHSALLVGREKTPALDVVPANMVQDAATPL